MYSHDPHCLYHDEPDLEPWFAMAREQLIAEERQYLRTVHNIPDSEISDEACEPYQFQIEKRAAKLHEQGVEP